VDGLVLRRSCPVLGTGGSLVMRDSTATSTPHPFKNRGVPHLKISSPERMNSGVMRELDGTQLIGEDLILSDSPIRRARSSSFARKCPVPL
jgi:hypothetical protein